VEILPNFQNVKSPAQM